MTAGRLERERRLDVLLTPIPLVRLSFLECRFAIAGSRKAQAELDRTRATQASGVTPNRRRHTNGARRGCPEPRRNGSCAEHPSRPRHPRGMDNEPDSRTSHTKHTTPPCHPT